jgi:hypothetical protein
LPDLEREEKYSTLKQAGVPSLFLINEGSGQYNSHYFTPQLNGNEDF